MAHRWPTAALLLALALPAAGAEDLPLRLVVSVTDHANVRGLERAQVYVERVFSAAGVAIEWEDSSASSCAVTLFLARTSPGVAMGRAAVKDRVSWVFPNRVISLAAAKNMDERIMLGRAIVHELGHLLGLEHARDGVMRAEIYTEEMEAKFAFSSGEIATLRSSLAGRSTVCR